MQCQNGSSQKRKRIQGSKRILGSKEIRSECRKGLSESVKVVENCSCQTMIFKASAQTGATMSSEEK
jgi:hypothetical protein